MHIILYSMEQQILKYKYFITGNTESRYNYFLLHLHLMRHPNYIQSIKDGNSYRSFFRLSLLGGDLIMPLMNSIPILR